jgi:hypothetical protein
LRDVPAAVCRWPNFSPAEIACRGTGKLLVNEAALYTACTAAAARHLSRLQRADHPQWTGRP